MVNFIWGAWLLGIALVPLALWWYARNVAKPAEAVVHHPDAEFIASLKPARVSRRRDLPALLFVATLALSLLALARPVAPLPQLDNRTTVMIAVDVSGSMRADDIKPSRFIAMQSAVRTFVKQLPSDLKLGLVSFAGTAALNVSPTSERQGLLDAVDAMFMARGTAIGAGLREAIAALPARTVLEKAGKPLEPNPPPAGNVFVSDSGLTLDFKPSGSAAIYRIDRLGKVSQLAKGDSLALPNGLLSSSDGALTVAPFGDKTVYIVAADAKQTALFTLSGGSLDGIEFWRGAYYVSSWETSSVYRIKDGAVSVVIDQIPSPADIAIDAKRGHLLIPVFNENRLVFQPL